MKNRHAEGVGSRLGVAILLVGLLCGAASAAEPRDLLVHGTGRSGWKNASLWAALVQTEGDQPAATRVLHRQIYKDTLWRELPRIPARAIALTDHGGELVLLLQNRSWVWYSESTHTSRFSYGPSLPGNARIVALAGRGKTLWALGRYPEAGNAGGSPTTQPAGWRAFVLDGGGWKEHPAALPEPMNQPHLICMELIGAEPHVAVWIDGAKYIRVYRLAKDMGEWVKTDEAPVGEPPRRIKLLDSEQGPTLWSQAGSLLGQLWKRGQWIPLTLGGTHPQPRAVDVTVAGDQLRALIWRDQDTILEQRFSSSGVRDGEPTAVNWTAHGAAPSSNWLATAIMALVAMLIAGALLRKRTANEEDQRQDE